MTEDENIDFSPSHTGFSQKRHSSFCQITYADSSTFAPSCIFSWIHDIHSPPRRAGHNQQLCRIIYVHGKSLTYCLDSRVRRVGNPTFARRKTDSAITIHSANGLTQHLPRSCIGPLLSHSPVIASYVKQLRLGYDAPAADGSVHWHRDPSRPGGTLRGAYEGNNYLH